MTVFWKTTKLFALFSLPFHFCDFITLELLNARNSMCPPSEIWVFPSSGKNHFCQTWMCIFWIPKVKMKSDRNQKQSGSYCGF